MRFRQVYVVKKRRSLFKRILIAMGIIAVIVAAAAIAYKLWGHKLFNRKKVIGKVDLDGDGQTDAVMLDTNGDGEVDTIIIKPESDDAE